VRAQPRKMNQMLIAADDYRRLPAAAIRSVR
jgi:hypothetical protein